MQKKKDGITMEKAFETPEINDNDLVYTYKEQYFTGFAPCFENGIYSLACCKGAKNGNGMRQNICNNFEKKGNIWVLAIAGGEIRCKGHNTSKIIYNPGDVIYLAKIEETFTWYEYSTSPKYKYRMDSYYVLKNDRVEWKNKIDKIHDTQADLEKDCGIGNVEVHSRAAADIFQNKKQILVSNEYYILEGNQPLSGNEKVLDVNRGFMYKEKKDLKCRTRALRNYIEKCKFFYYGGSNPFINSDKREESGCK